MNKPFQRIGAVSNARVGSDFELVAQQFFSDSGIDLKRGLRVPVGVGHKKKSHAFDLGCEERKCLVECKSHRWTAGHNIPGAKLTVWNEAMYYFHAAPSAYRKILFVLRDLRRGTGESLASYYLKNYWHLIPEGVEIWDYDDTNGSVQKLDA